jgi:Lrp/AsnC family transcriptional regulator, regulator for asnA, asnC and gidA
MGNNNEDIDFKITRLLQKNGRLPNTEIAKTLGVSEATVRNRMQNLIKSERIQVVALVNPLKLKSGIVGNLRITAEKSKLNHVAEGLRKLDELWYIAQQVGDGDFDVEYYVNTQRDFGHLMDKVNAIDGIITARASLIVRYIKYAGSPTV